MRRTLSLLLTAVCGFGATDVGWTAEPARVDLLIVVGAAGAKPYAPQFERWAQRWRKAGTARRARVEQIGVTTDMAIDAAADSVGDRERLVAALESFNEPHAGPLWIVLIGHGTFDGRAARFNLRGRDFSAAELAEWLQPLKRDVAIVNCSSCSGPFLNRLSGPGRIIVTATRSGHEATFTRFGDHLSQSIGELSSDLDQDGEVSLAEACHVAARATRESYEQQGRLQTEHALLDDNGDARGVAADRLQHNLDAAKSAAIDGLVARNLFLVADETRPQLNDSERRVRATVEQQLAELRGRRDTMSEDVYYDELERIVTPLTEIYQQLGTAEHTRR